MGIRLVKVEYNRELKMSVFHMLSYHLMNKKIRTVIGMNGEVDSIIVEGRDFTDCRYQVKFIDDLDVIALYCEHMGRRDCICLMDYEGKECEFRSEAVKEKVLGYHQYA